MIPVFQESYRSPDPSQARELHVEALLTSDGVPLLDERSVYVNDAIARRAKRSS